MLFAGIIFIVFYSIFDYIGGYTTPLKWVSLFCAVYLLVAALLFTKKWIDKNYR